VLFVRDDLSVLIAGDVIDLRNNQSIASALRAANRPHIAPAEFNVADAIQLGHGTRKLYVFSDPDCPYCRQLEGELPKLKDVQIYMFPFPLVSLHPNARSIAESIWCQPDRATAWHRYVAGGPAPQTATCDNPISRNLLLGERLQILGTPAMIFEDGTVVPGAISVERIEAQLAASAHK
jgi:thiol:disulfide interchange protein DsbC